ncbi:Galactoside O-acetyltransferase [Serratia fonticola]|uniref:Galactoside O-acetyltransferase n=1 Tax=Serratia fonticola TaxID=47917 RepID=A0A3S4YSH6_SERFO|nr:Galactoside O-acetyltransferase [Serratia fonticola]
MSYYTQEELMSLGLNSLGCNVNISKKASLYGCANISIGNNVRIDDFCVLSVGTGGLVIGDHIHIGVYSSIIGAGRVTLGNYANISSRVSIYSSNDDYSGRFMTNPTLPATVTNVRHAEVAIGKHVIIGSGSVILPGVTLSDGVAVGALSLVNKDCEAFVVYAGVPAIKINSRDRGLLKLESDFSGNRM